MHHLQTMMPFEAGTEIHKKKGEKEKLNKEIALDQSKNYTANIFSLLLHNKKGVL